MGVLITEKYQILRTNIRNPVARRNVALLMTGKMMGLGLALLVITWFMPQLAHAQTDTPDPMLSINAINTAWTLIAAFLVFGMQVGFVMLEAGFARERESV